LDVQGNPAKLHPPIPGVHNFGGAQLLTARLSQILRKKPTDQPTLRFHQVLDPDGEAYP
jgi:hypothetical protein